jgi:type I restriction enzyme S subunit
VSMIAWVDTPIKFLVSLNDEVLTETFPAAAEIHYVEISDVSEATGITWRDPIKFGDAPSRARRRLRDGDVLVSTVRTYLRAVAGVGNAPVEAVASTGFAVLRPKTIHTGFLKYAMLNSVVLDEVVARSVGVSYPAINASDLVAIKISTPVYIEQKKIATFLDRETAEIDAFIADQEGLIGLLAERRAATISHAVTKGLDPNVPMKDSGVEWLGQMASGWSLTRTRFLCDVGTGSGDTIDATDPGEFPFYVRSGTPLRSNVFQFEGDAVLTAGDGAGVGKIFHLVSGRFHAHQRVYVLTGFRDVTAEYFFFYFSSMFAKVALDGSAKSTVDSVRRPMITDFPVVYPDLATQRAIVDYLLSELSGLEAATADAREAIALSRERRSALISAAVTGRIDVREHGAVT